MELIISALPYPVHHANPPVEIPVDRLTLAKRRWRGVATNGREFGFDLEHSLPDGELVFNDGTDVYQLAQKPEPVLEIVPTGTADAARLGWLLGNLHFRIAVVDGTVRVPDDSAVRQLLEREHIHYHEIETVFQPLGGGHSHGH